MNLIDEILEEFAALGGCLATWWPIAEDILFDELLAADEPNEIVLH